jgi:hypothetical protein
MRFFVIIFTGLLIQALKNFKEDFSDYADSNDDTKKDLYDSIEEVVDAAIGRIVITLVLEIACFGMTYWWIQELRKRDDSNEDGSNLQFVRADVELTGASPGPQKGEV